MDDLTNNDTPKLSKIKKENPFKVPESYFDNFSDRLMIRLDSEKDTLPKSTNRIIRYLKPALGLAASFALIFMLVYWPLKSFMPEQVVQNNDTTEIIEMEYLSIIEGIDENSFYALLDENINGTNLTEEDLMSYMSLNVTNYELITGLEN